MLWASIFLELSQQHISTINQTEAKLQNFLSPEYGTSFQKEVPYF